VRVTFQREGAAIDPVVASERLAGVVTNRGVPGGHTAWAAVFGSASPARELLIPLPFRVVVREVDAPEHACRTPRQGAT
jgi:hypothetical protein